ncbi:MAG: (2Fe-2S) ferredoxin domain-containing protein [Gammaproteobacteria bacterium]|jgi:(2Fe-2S) ferredoxin|nr:(2Fe-2S) ferredoxin domain-containing protein [Gammaproteobacteria bacterium]MBT4146993.1 (2Fe-2S) ferredoxin domain-containing protein [Gammaproteobacteria bacterium]MBT5223322.1 (2Fe-2S) ferredoxin domain-containing protein [Gammaproteobacteria bacterium]MBT5827034.1 (2Fe-2S) ferredoxin domain-containing protein [Gammaproteobacteria bacterium]MBT5967161.1 (2Fe-2S) ferredoxin domain-containing protein [Gammaproteobacteria bacterium]
MTEIIKPTMVDYTRHLLVCVGEHCSDNNAGQALYDQLKDKFKESGLNEGALRVKRSRASCFGTCKSGPLICVQPDGVWYYDVTSEKLDRIIKEHLLGGAPVTDYIYHQGPGATI